MNMFEALQAIWTECPGAQIELTQVVGAYPGIRVRLRVCDTKPSLGENAFMPQRDIDTLPPGVLVNDVVRAARRLQRFRHACAEWRAAHITE